MRRGGKGFIRRIGWGLTPGGRGIFSHRGPHMPGGGGGGLFRVLGFPFRATSSLLRLAQLRAMFAKKNVQRGQHGRPRKGAKRKIARGQHPRGIKRPVIQQQKPKGRGQGRIPNGARIVGRALSQPYGRIKAPLF